MENEEREFRSPNEVVTPEGDEVPTPEPKEEEPASPKEESSEEMAAHLNREVEARRQLTARALKAEADKKALEAQLRASKISPTALNVEDYIDISASLEGLDQREKEYLAEQHKLTGQPLSEIRKGENFLFWQESYQRKVEKERALKPSGTQVESDKPSSLVDKLRNASLAEQEKLLADRGLYKAPRPKQDRVHIGSER